MPLNLNIRIFALLFKFAHLNFRGEYSSTTIPQTAYRVRKFLFGIFLFVVSLLPCFSYDNFEIANALKLASLVISFTQVFRVHNAH